MTGKQVLNEVQANCTGVLSYEVVDQGQAGYTFELTLKNGRTIALSYQMCEPDELVLGVYDTKAQEGDAPYENPLAMLSITPNQVKLEDWSEK